MQMKCNCPSHNTERACTRELNLKKARTPEMMRRALMLWLSLAEEDDDKAKHKARFGSHVDPALRDGTAPTEAELSQLLNEKADQLLPE